jgi:hypothetical protein
VNGESETASHPFSPEEMQHTSKLNISLSRQERGAHRPTLDTGVPRI